jgi:hypothetical protein
MRTRRLAGIAVAVTLAAGCALRVPAPKTAAGGPEAASASWARVLERFVDERGRIDFRGVASDSSDLDAFVAWVGAVSPRTSPSAFALRQEVLAYYLNAYNALAMYNVVHSGIPPELDSIKFRFFYRDRLLVGGKRTSLYRLENGLVRPLGDPRVHFALNCMVRGCPRLPREPFEAGRLDAQLDAAARLFFSEPRHVQLDPAGKTVRFSSILDFYTKDFLAKAPSLIAYANLYRNEKIPTGWKVAFLSYDWTINAQ